jgi:hypothetical protein
MKEKKTNLKSLLNFQEPMSSPTDVEILMLLKVILSWWMENL